MHTPTNRKNSESKPKNSKLETSFRKLTMGLRNYRDIKQAHLKNKGCQESTQYKQNRQCTFQPKLSANKYNELPQQKRSLKKFLQDQDKFTRIKRKKIEQLRQEIFRQEEEEFKAKPTLYSTSQRLSTQVSHKDKSVFQRLSKQKSLVHQVFQAEDMFSPKICFKSKSLRREKDVSNLLYQDAQRRRQKQQVHFEQLLKQEFKPQINSNTKNLVIRKIYMQFIKKVQEQTISPILAITVLSEIFNIDLNPNKSPEHEELCQKVLSYIADIRNQTVNSETLWNFIQTVINGHLLNSNFTEQQENQIMQNFGHFYTSRLTKSRKSIKSESYSFKPKILESSERLAQNYREKTLQSINSYLQNEKVGIQINKNSVKIEDLFIIEHMKKNAEKDKKRIQKQNSQFLQCSFRPNIDLSTNFMMQTQKISQKKVNLIVPRTTKTQELQKKVKIKKQINENQAMQDQSRMKTMYDIANFIPTKKTHTLTNRNSASKKKPEVKNIQKSVMRVTLARKNRELVTALNERGYPSNVENWDSFRRSIKKDIQKSSQQLKGYNSVQNLSDSLLKTSTLLNSKQLPI